MTGTMIRQTEDFLAVLNSRSQDIFKRLVERYIETGAPVGSWWLLHWQRDTEQRWRIVGIEAQQIDFVPPGSVIDPR